jgi:hypothetical protein
MYKFKDATKSGWSSLVAAALMSVIGTPLASAGSYIYSLTDLSLGYITTNCNNCVLNSSTITAWSMSVPGFISLASTTPGARLQVPAGDTDMVATPEAITFNFNAPYGIFLFATPSASVGYADDQGGNIGFGPGFGIVAACKNDFPGDCVFGGGGDGTESIGVAVVPFASFTAAAKLHLSTAAADSSFRLEGMFSLGGQPKVLPLGSPNLQLTVGSLALFLPAGSLSASGNGYEFHGPVNGGVLHLRIDQRGSGTYKFFAQGSGFDLTGTTLPVPVALVIATDGGQTQLASGDAEFSSLGKESDREDAVSSDDQKGSRGRTSDLSAAPGGCDASAQLGPTGQAGCHPAAGKPQ